MWKSLLHHVTNKHNFQRLYPKYPRCAHKPLKKEKARRKKWLKKNSPAYNSLEKVIFDKKNLSDMTHLTKSYHTGSLEVFHSLINCYAPKRQEFELNVMAARVKLAIIDHNNNVNRKQADVKQKRKGGADVGERKWRFVCSKLSKDWIAKPVKEEKSYAFVDELVMEVITRKQEGERISEKFENLKDRMEGPKNIAYVEQTEKSVILKKHRKNKRFSK